MESGWVQMWVWPEEIRKVRPEELHLGVQAGIPWESQAQWEEGWETPRESGWVQKWVWPEEHSWSGPRWEIQLEWPGGIHWETPLVIQ
jgi:hypothetical protein